MSALLQQLNTEIGTPALQAASSADGSLALIRHPFSASEGPIVGEDHLRLALCTAGGGRLQRTTSVAGMDAHWHPGQFSLTLPGEQGHFRSASLTIIGLAIDLRRTYLDLPPATSLESLAGQLTRDRVVTALLQGMAQAADADLLDDALLVASAGAVLGRLVQLSQPEKQPAPGARRLSAAQFKRLLAVTDDLHTQPTVDAMAAAVGLPQGPFSRALRAMVGQSPYRFALHRRMLQAQQRLAAGASVTQVAADTGYLNPSKFSAAFQRITGHLPSSIR